MSIDILICKLFKNINFKINIMKYTTAFLISIIFALCIAMEINYETHKELQKVHIELDESIYKAGYLDGVKAYQDSLKFDKTRFSNDSTELFKYLK